MSDGKTGADIIQFSIMYSMFDFNMYKEAKFKNKKYIIPMEYCRGEGLISSIFNDKAMPHLGFFTFKISASGYSEKIIAGNEGKVIFLNQQYELILPEIILHKLDS